jgi:hypothetical protein
MMQGGQYMIAEVDTLGKDDGLGNKAYKFTLI